jgi:drug/metabolite transporter (DMT)-like permease
LAYFLLDEHPSAFKVASMILILGGIYIAARPSAADEG